MEVIRLQVIELLPHPQRLLQLFCIVDELVTVILTQTLFLSKSGKTPGRLHNLTISEATTISLYRFLFPWPDFKHYYSFIKNYHQTDFPRLPHYDNMLTMQKQLLPFFIQFLGVLIAIHRAAFKNKKIGIVSGTPIGGLHFAQPARCHPTMLNACYHVVLWWLSTCETP
jgi:hypothetical protein